MVKLSLQRFSYSSFVLLRPFIVFGSSKSVSSRGDQIKVILETRVIVKKKMCYAILFPKILF